MGDLKLNGKEFNFDPNKKISKDELVNKNGLDVNKLETLFMEFDGIKFANGLSAQEAQTIIGLFDSNDDKKLSDNEVSDAKIKEFIKQNGGSADDASLLENIKTLIQTLANTFGKDNGGFYNITDKNGKVTEKYTLETNNGVTKKTHYSADGTKNNRIAEQWETGFKNYRKEWTGPNGERTLLEGTAVKDNGDGTYTLTVKRTDSRFEDAYYEMVFDSNGKELSRTDASGNKFTSNGAPIDNNGNVDGTEPAAQNGGEEKSVVVEAWGKGVTNSTLSGIITSAYGVKYGTDEYFAIETMVMNANPEIYGDADGNGGRARIIDGTRHNSVIHVGDTIKLPPYDGKTAEPAKGGTTTPAPATGGGTPAPRTGETAPDPTAPTDPVDEPDPLTDEGPAVDGEKVIVNDDGTVSVTTTHESHGETYESTTVYADESRTKKLSVTEKHNTFTKTITYNYVGNSDKLDTIVSKSNAGGTWNTITDQYNYKGELSSRVYSSNGWVEFYGEARAYVDKLKKGDITAIPPYGMRANEAAAIIKQFATMAKTAFADKNHYAGAITTLMDKFYGADFKNLQTVYSNTTGKSFGEDMAEMGISGAYMKRYISKLRNGAPEAARNSVNNIDAQALIDTHKIKNKGFGQSDKKALKKIMELYGNKTITAQQAVAIINKMYIGADTLGNILAGTKDKALEANVLKLLELVYSA